MNKYVCKVDLIYTYDIEVDALNEEEALMKAEHVDLSDKDWNNVLREVSDIEEVKENVINIPELPENVPEKVKQAYKVLAEYAQTEIAEVVKEPSTDTGLFSGIIPMDLEKTKIRKPTDTTVLTEHQIGVVKSMYSLYQAGNLVSVKTTQELTDMLNEMFGLNKNRSAYTKIWTEKDVANTNV